MKFVFAVALAMGFRKLLKGLSESAELYNDKVKNLDV